MEQPFNYEMPEDERLYREMRNKSLQGEPVQRTRKKVKINWKRFVASVVIMTSLTVGGTLAISHVAKDMRESIKDNQVYNTLLDEYNKEVFSKAIHHVDGTVGEIWIDYDALADAVDEASNNGVMSKDTCMSFNYQLVHSLNLEDYDNQLDQIVQKTDLGYDSFASYLENNEYANAEELKTGVKNELNSKVDADDLDEMLENDVIKSEVGGKNL